MARNVVEDATPVKVHKRPPRQSPAQKIRAAL
jgi:hypothetical protein